MIEVHLRWILSQNEDFPFRYKVSEQSTVGEICKMVKDQNNMWPGNPTFSVVKLRGQDAFLDDMKMINTFDNKEDILYLNFYAG